MSTDKVHPVTLKQHRHVMKLSREILSQNAGLIETYELSHRLARAYLDLTQRYKDLERMK